MRRALVWLRSVRDPVSDRGREVAKLSLASDSDRRWVVWLPPWPTGVVVVSDLGSGLPRIWVSQFWVGAQAYGHGPWFSLGQVWPCFSGLGLLDGPEH